MEMKRAFMKAVTVCVEIRQKVAKDPLPVPGGAGLMLLHFSPLNSSRSPSTGENTATLARERKEIWPFGIHSLPPSFRGFLFACPHVGQSCLIAPADPPKHEGVTKKGSLLVRKYFGGLPGDPLPL